jgi:hypothetical protein
LIRRLFLSAIVGAALVASVALLYSWSADSWRVRATSMLLSAVMLLGAGVVYRRRTKRLVRSSRVTYDESRIEHRRPDGATESVAWSALSGVELFTTAEGPWSEDVFLALLGAESKAVCIIPQASEGFHLLVKRLVTLPGFDNQELIAAMGSTGNARFVYWRRAQ